MTETFRPFERALENRDVVVDVRDEAAYRAGHVPGAVNVPFESFRDQTDETPGELPTAADFGALLGDAGVAPGDRIVAYDDDCGVYAARLLVTAEAFGHDPDRLLLLDGDYTAWERDHEVSTDAPDAAPRRYDCERAADGPLIDADALEAALDSDAVIVDTRDPAEYDTVRLPGAVNLQWRRLVDEDERRLRPPAECREILANAGIGPERPVRLYCNTARRPSFVYTALRELGYDDVAFYEGGVGAWVNRGGDVETPI